MRRRSEAPAYTRADLAAEAAALDHPDAFSALTLAGTRPVAPGPVDDDLYRSRRGDDGPTVRAPDAQLARPRCRGQMGMVFSQLVCEPGWRERLPELALPAAPGQHRQRHPRARFTGG